MSDAVERAVNHGRQRVQVALLFVPQVDCALAQRSVVLLHATHLLLLEVVFERRLVGATLLQILLDRAQLTRAFHERRVGNGQLALGAREATLQIANLRLDELREKGRLRWEKQGMEKVRAGSMDPNHDKHSVQ